MEIDADKFFSLDAYIDVHSHSNSRAGFLYMNPLPASHSGCAPLAEFLYRLPKAMASLVPGFQLSKCCCSTEAAKAACSRRAAGMHLPNTLCYTFEISFFNAVEDSLASTHKSGRAAAQNGSVVRLPCHAAVSETPKVHSSVSAERPVCRVCLLWTMQIPYLDTMIWVKTLLAPSLPFTTNPAAMAGNKHLLRTRSTCDCIIHDTIRFCIIHDPRATPRHM